MKRGYIFNLKAIKQRICIGFCRCLMEQYGWYIYTSVFCYNLCTTISPIPRTVYYEDCGHLKLECCFFSWYCLLFVLCFVYVCIKWRCIQNKPSLKKQTLSHKKD